MIDIGASSLLYPQYVDVYHIVSAVIDGMIVAA